METNLQLVPEQHVDNSETDGTGRPTDPLSFVLPPKQRSKRAVRPAGRWMRFAQEERGAVTAEYAIVIMAAVAFAGLLVAILRSAEIRAMLVQLVEDALGAAG